MRGNESLKASPLDEDTLEWPLLDSPVLPPEALVANNVMEQETRQQGASAAASATLQPRQPAHRGGEGLLVGTSKEQSGEEQQGAMLLPSAPPTPFYSDADLVRELCTLTLHS